MSEAGRPGYPFFGVTGIELEYPIVDADLVARPLVENLFRRMAGRPTSDVEWGEAEFSNELAAHVFEIKTAGPEKNLAEAERKIFAGLGDAIRTLREEFGARLMPTGMHPFMDPATGEIWKRSGRAIYEAYDRVFGIHGHGWLNVQSCHINLPFGTESETVALHNAMACLMPYLPALSASSPIYEGRLGPAADNRLAFYRANQEKIPSIAGDVVPEYMESYAQYQRVILRRIYRELRGVPGAEPLRHEWVNSRGAIVRFYRDAIELRILDTQECVKMDIAVAVFTRNVLKGLTKRILAGTLRLPPHTMLVEDFNRVVGSGGRAMVDAEHFSAAKKKGGMKAEKVLRGLLELAEVEGGESDRGYLQMVERRLRKGNLSESIRAKVEGRSGWGDGGERDYIRGIYEELIQCLEANEPWGI